ncbi:PEP-CTERM sorting domain-containing protein [Geminisphaera colitermitum]|uniref:PEP-CTERM sorting domain-containing protein n=1 Tax=Geminisphaera colitermitum TaxID=1148786 RepID=UPI00069371A5|nr:PEP-CTERM sorting domain-containing protein [Geminisphaera colitermitum]
MNSSSIPSPIRSVIHPLISTSARCGAVGLAALLLAASTQAALIWEADFESYNTSSGAVALTIASTGANDTFTAALPNANLGSAVSEVRNVGVPSFMSGNALYIGGTSLASSGVSFALQQNKIASVGASGVLVASFDLYNVSVSGVNTTGEARTSAGRSGSTMLSTSTPVDTAIRVTIVINKTGSDVTLPGTLGSLASGSATIYRFDGTTFEGRATTTSIGDNVTGFATGFSLSSSVVGSSTYGLWLDNFSVWNSLTDTVNGTSILSLPPSNIPEPSTVALLAGLAALAGAAGIRRLRV